jgi:alpha-L-rhamnosidase
VPVDLRCERAIDPIGIGVAHPRLSWRLEGGREQRAARVVVDDWDPGWIEGFRQQIAYTGPGLTTRTSHTWRVKVRTEAGESPWSDAATFEMGLLEASDWTASMITARAETPVVEFATSFDIDGAVAKARLYVTAHGAFVSYLDDVEVGDEVLAPGWTSYHKRLAVRTHDVTSLVREGPNELRALVAPAWFSGSFGLDRSKPVYGDHVALLAQLEVTLRSGRMVTIASDGHWRASSTSFALAEIYDGETFDPSLAGEPCDVTTIDLDVATLVWPTVPPVWRTETVAPVSSRTVDGVTQYDFGQNLVGRLRVTSASPTEMRHAELLGPDKRLYTEPLRTAKATDSSTVGGTYEPTFTFHGFRYAEIAGDVRGVEAIVTHSDLERTGSFGCSDDLIDRLHANVVWGWRGNSVSVPTDCPQRDERLGWTGDAQVFSPTASFLYDCETFWENWLADLAADQAENGAVPPVIPATGLSIGVGAAGWGDAACVVPWTTYVAYGDDHVLREALPSMTRWVDYVYSRLDDDLRWRGDFQFGDWLDPDAPTSQPWKAKARFDLVAGAYAAHSTDLVVRSARAIGDDALASRYATRASELRAAWQRNYSDEALRTQTGCALAIGFSLVDEPDDYGEALAQLVRDADTHLATGFLGTPLLLPALARTGHLDVAYALLEQRTPPSWLYQVVAGATTIWERWDALRPDGSVPMDDLGTAERAERETANPSAGGSGGAAPPTSGSSGSSMVSFNHYAYGCVAEFLHTTVAGLAPDPDDPGYHHVIVAPRPGGSLTSARAAIDSRYGRTAVSWRVGDGALTVDVVVPPNAWATVTLPGTEPVDVATGEHRFTRAWPV